MLPCGPRVPASGRAAVMFCSPRASSPHRVRGRIDVPAVMAQSAEVTAESFARAEHASVEARDPRAARIAARRLSRRALPISAVVATDIVSKAHRSGAGSNSIPRLSSP